MNYTDFFSGQQTPATPLQLAQALQPQAQQGMQGGVQSNSGFGNGMAQMGQTMQNMLIQNAVASARGQQPPFPGLQSAMNSAFGGAQGGSPDAVMNTQAFSPQSMMINPMTMGGAPQPDYMVNQNALSQSALMNPATMGGG